MRAQRLLPSVIAISFLASTHLASQAPQTRAGFWLSGGYGLGTAAWQCDGCAKQSHGTRGGFLRFGGTASKTVLLGLEMNGGVLDVGTTEVRTGYLMAFTAYWYPNAARGLFLKGGLGQGLYMQKTPTVRAESQSAALLAGAGYDIRVARTISITPMLTVWRSTRANLNTDSTTLATGLRQAGAELHVGVTFHSLWAGKNPPAELPQIRRGFWLGLGYGGSNIAWRCAGCATHDHGAGSAVIRLGGTISKRVLLGAEMISTGRRLGPFESFGPDSAFQGTNTSYAALTTYWYPSVNGGLFLKSGVGASWYSEQMASSKATSNGGVILAGAGYDIRAADMTSLTPMLTFWISTKADLKDGNTTLATGWRHSGVTFQLGVTFH